MTRQIEDQVQQYLGCSQKVLAKYLGVSPQALIQNREKSFSSIIDNPVGKRLDLLLYLLECAFQDQTIDSTNIHKILAHPAFKDKHGWKIDCLSAIHEEYDKFVLFEVFQKALEELRSKLDKLPKKNGLYNQIHSF
jgi:hypothetical protein